MAEQSNEGPRPSTQKQRTPSLTLQQLQAANYFGNMPLESPLFLPIMPVSVHTCLVRRSSQSRSPPCSSCASFAGGAIAYHGYTTLDSTFVSGQHRASGVVWACRTQQGSVSRANTQSGMPNSFRLCCRQCSQRVACIVRSTQQTRVFFTTSLLTALPAGLRARH
jgi:hypothetical protein